jgi:hypothetical protein
MASSVAADSLSDQHRHHLLGVLGVYVNTARSTIFVSTTFGFATVADPSTVCASAAIYSDQFSTSAAGNNFGSTAINVDYA